MLKPNFTGTWSFNRTQSVLQIPAPDATTFIIEHREPNLHLSRTHVVGERHDSISLDLTTDGQEIQRELGDGLQFRGRAYWDGDALVFDTSLNRAGEEARNLVRYTLTNDGATLRAEEHLRSSSLNYDNVWILDRVEPSSRASVPAL